MIDFNDMPGLRLVDLEQGFIIGVCKAKDFRKRVV